MMQVLGVSNCGQDDEPGGVVFLAANHRMIYGDKTHMMMMMRHKHRLDREFFVCISCNIYHDAPVRGSTDAQGGNVQCVLHLHRSSSPSPSLSFSFSSFYFNWKKKTKIVNLRKEKGKKKKIDTNT